LHVYVFNLSSKNRKYIGEGRHPFFCLYTAFKYLVYTMFYSVLSVSVQSPSEETNVSIFYIRVWDSKVSSTT
jgi:hypothetical protein